MGIQVQWDNDEKTILRYDYQARWSWNELYQAVDQGYHLIDSVAHPVAVIIDLTASEGIPPGALSHARSIQQRAHPRISMNVAVNAGGLLSTLTHTFLRLYSALMQATSVHFAATVEEARAVIAERQVSCKY